ncbi:hypothetical protein ACFW4K_26750 [Nocardiopsis alba]|uniref:hypothetical protein n=1 Tax=Nocardiopsis alba TaxID=53437 RepID=UPI00366D60BD
MIYKVMGFLVLAIGLVIALMSIQDAGSSSQPSTPSLPARQAPVDAPNLPALCEGQDYVDYDDCGY